MHDLAVQPERPLARGEHTHERRGVEHARDQRTDAVDEVLTVVEDEQGLGAAQPLAEVRAVHERNRVGDDGRDVVRVPSRVEPDQPRSCLLYTSPSPRD